MKIVTVTTTSPLKVRETATSSEVPARVMPRNDAWAPAVNDRVIAEMISGRLYLIGGA